MINPTCPHTANGHPVTGLRISKNGKRLVGRVNGKKLRWTLEGHRWLIDGPDLMDLQPAEPVVNRWRGSERPEAGTTGQRPQ